MDKLSIILSTRQSTGNNEVEVVGECEKEYNALALYSFATEIIQKAKACNGMMIPWVREPQFQKFCYSFRFETEDDKKKFLGNLS